MNCFFSVSYYFHISLITYIIKDTYYTYYYVSYVSYYTYIVKIFVKDVPKFM